MNNFGRKGCKLRGGRSGFGKDGRIRVERKIERRRVGPCMMDWADRRFEQRLKCEVVS